MSTLPVRCSWCGRDPLYVTRRLDPEMIRLGKLPGYYNGHVPSTAINSMIAALCCMLYGFDRIVLSNERSASEGNTDWDGREVNHQYSKSIAFEDHIARILGDAIHQICQPVQSCPTGHTHIRNGRRYRHTNGFQLLRTSRYS